MPSRNGQKTVHCYHCRHAFDVGGKTQSTSCPACSKRIVVEDVVIKQLTPVKAIQTCGHLLVDKKGSVMAELVQAGLGVDVLGHLDANVISGGPVHIGAKARWKGDCRAPSLTIEDGARIEHGAFQVPDAELVAAQRAAPVPAGAPAPEPGKGAKATKPTKPTRARRARPSKPRPASATSASKRRSSR